VLTAFKIRTFTALVAVSDSLQHIMSSESPLPTPTQNVALDTSKLPASTTSSVWDRISNWVSENKAVVYTIAGVAVVVTGAGVVYYLSDSSKSSASSTPSVPKKSKNQRRKEKKKAEEEKKAKAASVQEGSSPTSWSLHNR
jgi:import receptor subunit TOM70